MKVEHFEMEVLNKGLELALEFGKNWQQPIQERIVVEYPSLDQQQAGFLNFICEKAMNDTNEFIHQTLNKSRMESDKLNEELELYIKDNYPWINKDNYSHLFSQGCYYAWKDGLI